MVYFQESFIYFGGRGSDRSSMIAKFDSMTRQWSKIGNLVAGREDHGAIFDGIYFLIIGGYGETIKTEKCSLSGSTMTCQQQQPELTEYQQYPELFLVPDNFRGNS